MGFFKLKKKSEVPEELPKLGTNNNSLNTDTSPMQIQNLPSASNQNFYSSEKNQNIFPENNLPKRQIQSPFASAPEIKTLEIKKIEPFSILPRLPEIKNQALPSKIPQEITPEIDPEKIKEDKGFFSELIKNINEESSDIKKLEDWYSRKFKFQDTVGQMREYWEKQNTGVMVQAIGKGFKENLLEKTKRLQSFEKQWQSLYFELIEKEEEIRKEEREIKKVLSEFLEECKKRKEIKKIKSPSENKETDLNEIKN